MEDSDSIKSEIVAQELHRSLKCVLILIEVFLEFSVI